MILLKEEYGSIWARELGEVSSGLPRNTIIQLCIAQQWVFNTTAKKKFIAGQSASNEVDILVLLMLAS